MNEAITAVILSQEPGQSIHKALQSFLRNDSYLLEVDANERTITTRLAYYLQQELPAWHVDCEYNRDGIDPKRLEYLELNPDSQDTNAKTVFPDIVIHKRGNADNHLVLELKKSSNSVSRNNDFVKLNGYRKQLGYKYAAFIEMTVGNEPKVGVFEWVGIEPI